MLEIKYASRFKKDYKKIKNSGRYNIQDLIDIMKDIANLIPLDPSKNDHPLKGNLSDLRECHIKPDWLLMYKIEDNLVTFTRTGSHAELYE